MVLHFNEAKAYKGTVAINVRNSLLVALMKHTRHFWQHYCDLLRVSGKEKSDSTELHKVMKELAMKPKKRKVNAKKKKKILQKIELDFDIGLKDLEESFENLEEVEESDETLLYRAMMDLVEIYDDIWAAHHLPEHRHH